MRAYALSVPNLGTAASQRSSGRPTHRTMVARVSSSCLNQLFTLAHCVLTEPERQRHGTFERHSHRNAAPGFNLMCCTITGPEQHFRVPARHGTPFMQRANVEGTRRSGRYPGATRVVRLPVEKSFHRTEAESRKELARAPAAGVHPHSVTKVTPSATSRFEFPATQA